MFLLRFIVSMLFFLSTNSFGLTMQVMDNDINKVIFHAKGQPLVNVIGEGGKVEGKAELKDNFVTGEFKVLMDNFKTDDKTRDSHLKEIWIPIDKYPYVTLKLHKTPSKGEVSFNGDLTIKGETKPVVGKATIVVIDNKVRVRARFNVKLSDYPSIGIPNWKKIFIRDVIDVKVYFEAIAIK